MVAELEGLAENLGVTLRVERLAQGPVRMTHGSCRLNGSEVIFIDSRLKPGERLAALCDELARFEPDIENLYVSPALRQYLDRRRQTYRRSA